MEENRYRRKSLDFMTEEREEEIEEAQGRRDLASLHAPTVGSRGANCLLTAVHASISIVPGYNNCVCANFCGCVC